MVHPRSGSASPGEAKRVVEVSHLTREQRHAASQIVNRFREGAAVQVLSGPRECGKSEVAQAVAASLEGDNAVAFISKQLDLPPAQKKLMMEAYGSYSYLLSAILKQLGFFVRGEEHDLVDQMVEQLRNVRLEEKRLLIVLDEAHDVSPAVWKRFQSWLDFQDRGVRMFQVLIVGSPALKTLLNESAFRGWRKWIRGRYELKLLSGGALSEEARRILKLSCDSINRRSKTQEPITAPTISWAAIRKIAKESGGRPGRLTELVKRALGASLRDGGCRITYRFLKRADALRSPAAQMYRARQSQRAKTPESAQKESKPGMKIPRRAPRASTPKVSSHPLDWMRYALGALLVLFALGAGWGVTAWLSVPNDGSVPLTAEAPVEEDDALFEDEEIDITQLASSENSLVEPIADSSWVEGFVEETETELAKEATSSPWDETDDSDDDPWGSDDEAVPVQALDVAKTTGSDEGGWEPLKDLSPLDNLELEPAEEVASGAVPIEATDETELFGPIDGPQTAAAEKLPSIPLEQAAPAVKRNPPAPAYADAPPRDLNPAPFAPAREVAPTPKRGSGKLKNRKALMDRLSRLEKTLNR